MSYSDFFITKNFMIMVSQKKKDDITKSVIPYLENRALNIFETTRIYSNIIYY